MHDCILGEKTAPCYMIGAAPLPQAKSFSTAALQEHIKSKSRRRPCSCVRRSAEVMEASISLPLLLQILITVAPDPSLRSPLSPSSCLSNHISHSPL